MLTHPSTGKVSGATGVLFKASLSVYTDITSIGGMMAFNPCLVLYMYRTTAVPWTSNVAIDHDHYNDF